MLKGLQLLTWILDETNGSTELLTLRSSLDAFMMMLECDYAAYISVTINSCELLHVSECCEDCCQDELVHCIRLH